MNIIRVILFSFFIFLFLSVKGQKKSILLQSSFDGKEDILKWSKEVCCSHSINIVDSLSREVGGKSIRFQLNKEDPKVARGKRSELRLKPETESERWYGMSLFLPGDYKLDSEPEILIQWHEIPDHHLGESSRMPPIALSIKNNCWFLTIVWSKDSVNTNKTKSGIKIIDLGSIEMNKWTDWVFHIDFSWKQNGITQVWKNNNLIIDYKGPNMYNDEKFPYLKIGIYKWSWNSINSKSLISERTIFFDQVKVGNMHADFLKVAPSTK